MRGYGVLLVPFSWAVGVLRRPHKTIWSLGPLRFVLHHQLEVWKALDHRPLRD